MLKYSTVDPKNWDRQAKLEIPPMRRWIFRNCAANIYRIWRDSIFGICVEVARHISWKFTFFLKPEKSPRRQVKRHLNIPSRVIHSTMEKSAKKDGWIWMERRLFFLGNLNSVPSSASASAQFNIHESWSKPPTSHPLSLARQKNGKSEGKVHPMDGVKKRREGKSFSSKWILNRRNT